MNAKLVDNIIISLEFQFFFPKWSVIISILGVNLLINFESAYKTGECQQETEAQYQAPSKKQLKPVHLGSKILCLL